jgi:AraC-like DNA-binding protein
MFPDESALRADGSRIMESAHRWSDGVRTEWSYALRTAYQRIVADALDGDPTCIGSMTEDLRTHLPEPGSATETLLLRESLDRQLGHLARTVHQRYHTRFAPGVCSAPGTRAGLAWTSADEPVDRLLEQWRMHYLAWFDEYHTLPAALRAKRILQEQFAEPLTLEVLSERVGASRTVLSAQFVTFFGHSPANYLARVRVREGLRKLHASEQSIDDVARAVGYQSGTKFYARVRRFTGLTPASIRALDEQAFDELLRVRLSLRVSDQQALAAPTPWMRRVEDRRRAERRVAERRAG